MSAQTSRLPSRFPVGTRYVIEGRGGHIHLRYLEFPDGRQVALPVELNARELNARELNAREVGAGKRARPVARRQRGTESRNPKKNSHSAGTTRALAR